VEWTQRDVESPHTVTFLSGTQEPELFLAEPQPNGPPTLVLNPVAVAPAGGSTYSGQGYFNSGWIWGTEVPSVALPASQPRTYSLIFDTAGTYNYLCLLHDPLGMVGQVTVLAVGAPAQLPVTGGSDPRSSAWWLVVIGLGMMAAGMLLGLLWHRLLTELRQPSS
jgi:plastocyanin